MFLIFFIFFIFFILFYLLNFFMSVKDSFLSKLDFFECGFLSLNWVSKYFSINFFIMMVIFVVFDLEIVMLVSFLISSSFSFFGFLVFFVFVFFGFFMEWYFGKLLWLM